MVYVECWVNQSLPLIKQLVYEVMIEELNLIVLKTVDMPTDLEMELKRFRPPSQEEEKHTPPAPKRRRCSLCTTETGLRRLITNVRNVRRLSNCLKQIWCTMDDLPQKYEVNI